PVYFLEVSKGDPKLKEATATTGGMSAGARMIKYSSATMRQLADQLSSYFERQVLDRTDLQSRYEINLSFAPVNANPSIDAAVLEVLPSIFSALERTVGTEARVGQRTRGSPGDRQGPNAVRELSGAHLLRNGDFGTW